MALFALKPARNGACGIIVAGGVVVKITLERAASRQQRRWKRQSTLAVPA